MNLGDLNETVTVLRRVVTGRDAVGGEIAEWTSIDDWPVHVLLLTGAERVGVSDAPTNVNVYRITGRNRSDLQPSMRLRRGRSDLEIASVPQMPRSPWTAVDCREVVRG